MLAATVRSGGGVGVGGDSSDDAALLRDSSGDLHGAESPLGLARARSLEGAAAVLARAAPQSSHGTAATAASQGQLAGYSAGGLPGQPAAAGLPARAGSALPGAATAPVTLGSALSGVGRGAAHVAHAAHGTEGRAGPFGGEQQEGSSGAVDGSVDLSLFGPAAHVAVAANTRASLLPSQAAAAAATAAALAAAPVSSHAALEGVLGGATSGTGLGGSPSAGAVMPLTLLSKKQRKALLLKASP